MEQVMLISNPMAGSVSPRHKEVIVSALRADFKLEVTDTEGRNHASELRRGFVGAALAAEQEVAQYGLVHDGDEVLAYLKARLEGRKASRPRKRKL